MTILAIPLLVVGVLISPYTMQGQRCFAVGFASQGGYCFEQGSQMPESIKYGLMAAGFVLLYAGRRQIQRKRERRRNSSCPALCRASTSCYRLPHIKRAMAGTSPAMTFEGVAATIGPTRGKKSCVFTTTATPT